MFAVPEVAKIAEIPYGTLAKQLGPRGELSKYLKSEGQGKERVLTYRDALRVGILASIKRRGAAKEAIDKVARFVDQADFDWRLSQGEKYVVIAGADVFLCREDAVLRREGGPGFAQFIVVDLALCIDRLKAYRDSRK